VNCWGGLFEVTYNGKIENLKLQEEEVESVSVLPLREVLDKSEQNPEEWMPDGIHALRLYEQYLTDRRLKRKLLHGYSSGNLNQYKLRPKPKVVFFDCDDCLYFDGWTVAKRLTAKINEWCVARGMETGSAYKLYKKYGTALKGLIAEGLIPDSEEELDQYLRDVHDIPIHDLIAKDDRLRSVLLAMDPTIPKYIFTASVRHHAERCLKALGIEDLFVDIIDVKSCNWESKHSPSSFRAAMKIAGVEDPESCIFFDDSLKNLEAARQIGWRAVLVGRVGRDSGDTVSSPNAEHEIDQIHELQFIFPELFEHISD